MSLSRTRKRMFIAGVVVCVTAGALVVGCMNKKRTKWEGSEQTKAKPGSSDPWKAPPSASEKKNPVPSDAQSIAAGKKVFTQHCVMCHGETGKGNGPAAAGLQTKPANLTSPSLSKETDGALFWKIENGHSPMPSFKPLLTDKEVWEVIDYVRTLSAKS